MSKLTSGVRRRERQSRALDRLLAQAAQPRPLGPTPNEDARRNAEIETLKQRSGRSYDV